MAGKHSEHDFSDKMKRLRKKKGILFEELSRETGYDVEYLESVESGRCRPPVSAIIRISEALKVDAGTFLSADKEQPRSVKAESFNKREKAYSYKVLTPNAQNKHMKAFLVTIDPEKEHEGVEYSHDGEEFIYALDGRLKITVGKQEHFLKRGQTIHFNSSLVHKLHNPGKTKTQLIVVLYTP
jgi:transcriptional regulator with XRE-family HTH domain